MILGVTIAKERETGKWVVVDDPNTPVSKQRRNFRRIGATVAEVYDEVQLIASVGGRIKRRKLRKIDVKAAGVVKSIPAVEDEDEQDNDQEEVQPPAGTPENPLE